MELAFFIPGIPRPGGSKFAQVLMRGPKGRQQIVFKNGRPVVIVRESQTKTNAEWKKSCATIAKKAISGTPLDVPLFLIVTFVMPRPQKHYRSNGDLRDDAPTFHTQAPDATKLLRSTEDALTGIAWRDDSLIAMQAARKVYGENPGAHVTIAMLGPSDEKMTTMDVATVAPLFADLDTVKG